MNYLDLVEEFHVAFKYRQPTPHHPSLDHDTCILRVSLIQEELAELVEAVAKDHRVEQLDALCDLQYVISGAWLALGMRDFRDGSVRLGNGGCELLDFLAAHSHFAKQLFKRSIPGTMMSLANLEVTLMNVVELLGFAEVFDAAFAEVHRSNMSKLFLSRFDKHPDAAVYEANERGQWIGRRADGKILKPPTYSPANLSQFICSPAS